MLQLEILATIQHIPLITLITADSRTPERGWTTLGCVHAIGSSQ
jgi:hypothetical protein